MDAFFIFAFPYFYAATYNTLVPTGNPIDMIPGIHEKYAIIGTAALCCSIKFVYSPILITCAHVFVYSLLFLFVRC